VTCCFNLCSQHFTNIYEIENNDRQTQTQLFPNEPKPPELSGEALNFGDSSGPLFATYSESAEDEDDKMVEHWQKDADGILIFVSPRVGIHIFVHIYWITIDRPVLCRGRCAPCRDRPGPEAKQPGYILILP
jgi:hypothetical protein